MFFKTNVSVGSALAMVLSVAAQATTPIAYTGSQQVGSILASYTIETDGTLGEIGAGQVLSYSVTLADSLSSYTFGTATGARPIAGSLVASASSLTFQNMAEPLSFTQDPAVPGVYPGTLLFAASQVSAQISDAFGTRNMLARLTNPIATAPMPPPSAVPEPAAWEMMIVGFAAIGGAMRRRRWSTKVAFC